MNESNPELKVHVSDEDPTSEIKEVIEGGEFHKVRKEFTEISTRFVDLLKDLESTPDADEQRRKDLEQEIAETRKKLEKATESTKLLFEKIKGLAEQAIVITDTELNSINERLDKIRKQQI